MKNTLVTAMILGTLPLAASAGGPSAMATDQPIAAPVAAAPPLPASFDGAYAGVEYASASSSGEFAFSLVVGGTVPSGDVSFDDARGWGAYGGYNLSRGNFVYGAELRFQNFDDFTFAALEFENALDLRARAGFASGPVLFYGAAGWSTLSTINGADEEDSIDGWNFGGGIEYQITDWANVGLDYTRRVLDGKFSPDADFDGDVDTISFRAGYNF